MRFIGNHDTGSPTEINLNIILIEILAIIIKITIILITQFYYILPGTKTLKERRKIKFFFKLVPFNEKIVFPMITANILIKTFEFLISREIRNYGR